MEFIGYYYCDVILLKVITTASIKIRRTKLPRSSKRAGLKAILVLRAPFATHISVGYGVNV